MPRDAIDTSHAYLDGPNWARVTVRAGVVFLVGLAAALWAMLSALEHLTAHDEAVRVLRAALVDPTTDRLEAAMQDPNIGDPVVVADDLVLIDLPRQTVVDGFGVAVQTASERRAEELWRDGVPLDPGPSRTQVGLPRSLINQLSASEHDRAAGARVAATILLGAALLVAGIAGYAGLSAAVFGVPAAGLLVGWILVRIQIWILHAAFDRTSLQSEAYEGALDRVTAQEPRYLLIGAIGLGVATSVFRSIRPRRRAPAPAQQPAPGTAIPEVAPGQQIVYVPVAVSAETGQPVVAPPPPGTAPPVPATPARRVLAAVPPEDSEQAKG